MARVALNLRGVPREAVVRGDVLLTPGAWLPTAELDARLSGVRGAAPDLAELPEQLTLHVGSAAVAARVRPLGDDVVRLRLRHPVPLRIGDRAVLRDPGRRRVAAGLTVLDVAPPLLRRRGAAARRAAELADVHGPDAAGELRRRGVVRRADLVAMGVPAAAGRRAAGAGCGRPPARSRAGDGPGRASGGRGGRARRRGPARPGAAAGGGAAGARPAGRAAGRGGAEARRRRAPTEALTLRDGRVAALAGAGLPPAVRAALEELRADLQQRPFDAPEAARLAALGLGPRQLASLVRSGELLRVADGVVLLPGADDRAVAVLATLGPEFSLSAARQALGTTRRVAVPLLELLARTGRTERTADGGHRLVGPAPVTADRRVR